MEPREGSSRLTRIPSRVRLWLGSGWFRLRGGWLQILQTALAASIAWFLAVFLLGLDQPTFAPIAAVISLGVAVGDRGRRALELTIGVAFGVALATLLVSFLGIGAVQAGVLVVIAMVLAVFLGRGDLGVNEAAISAMIIMVTFAASSSNFTPVDRFLEALIGGGAALLVNAILPVNPERMVENAAHPVFEESVSVLEEVAAALENGDVERAQHAYVKAREIDARVSGLKEALAAGRDTAQLAPTRRRSLKHLDLYSGAADQIDLTVRDVRSVARAALSVVRPEDPAPEKIPSSLRSLGRATEALGVYLKVSGEPEEVRRRALEAAAEAGALLCEREDLSRSLDFNGLVHEIHSATVDLLGGTGMDHASILQAMAESSKHTIEPE